MVSLHGNPIITGDKYVINKLRCNLCSKIFAPEEYETNLKQLPKYSASASAAIAINKYQMGTTLVRIAKMQQMAGIPLAESTQWDLLNEMSYRVEPILPILECLAAQSNEFKYDDTSNKILSASGAIKTTAVITKYEEHTIKLFYTGLNTAGENINNLLGKRCNQNKFATMTDASESNFSSNMPLDIFTKMIICLCLAHGRRNFYKLVDFFPVECDFVLGCISKVYEVEKYCVDNNLTADERLDRHRKFSQPQMNCLRNWLINQLKFKSNIEPNSPLGQAVQYMIKNWAGLTRFLTVAGVAIDNNHCEQLIKVAILHRKNSLFYKTSRGAKVGSVFMSLIHTCAANGINPYDYLIFLHENYELVNQKPQLFLPWNYQEGLAQFTKEAA